MKLVGTQAFLCVLTPTSLMLLLTIADFLSLQYWKEVAPWLTIVGVWYWSLYRPDILPVWMIFIIGFLQDLLHIGIPYGTHALIMIMGHLLVIHQRRYIIVQPFLINWLLFSFFAVLSIMGRWLISVILEFTLFPFQGIITSFLITAGSFPLIFFISAVCHRYIIGQQREII